MVTSKMKHSKQQSNPTSAWYGRSVLLATLFFWWLAVYQIGSLALERGFFETSIKWRVIAGGAALVGVVLLVICLLSFSKHIQPLAGLAARVFGLLQRLKAINLLGVVLCALLFCFLIFGTYGYLITNVWARLSILWLVSLTAAVFLRAAFPTLEGAKAFLLVMLGIMVVYKAAGFIPEVNNYPLTLGWSESSRYYYASLFFSQSLYGQDFARPFLHPTRYMLQSIPFLWPGLPIVAHRLWQVLLWLGMTGLTAGLLVRRLALPDRWLRWGVVAWAFLFLFQGPVYYHLLVCVAIILAGFGPRKFWPSLAAVVIASLWAGISRVNWFPVPAFLAVTIYLLEVPVCESRSLVDYLRRPFLWAAAGGASALASQAAYIFLSGNQDASSFGSSFTSDLLWYRLWPSATYAPGILPMSVLISLPLLVSIGLWLGGRRWHWLRLLGVGSMLLVLFAGGLVVSTKIGGGSNLHNMDAFLVLLLVCGGWIIFRRFTPETSVPPVRIPWTLVAVIAVMPVYLLIQEGGQFPTRDYQLAWDDVAEVRQRVEEVTSRGGRVLFIWQRQLVTFGLVGDVQMEEPYETVELMEMAMSNNQDYLNQFYTDLREHRYDLIIDGAQNVVYKGPEDGFPEENNVWVDRVTLPLLEYYESSYVLPYSRISFLVPKP